MLFRSEVFIRLIRIPTYLPTYIIHRVSINYSSSPHPWFLRLIIPKDNNAFFTVFIDLSDKIRNCLLFFQEKKILLREHEDVNLTQLEGGVQ